MNYKKLIVVLLSSTIGCGHAADWKYIDGTSLYVDLDSRKENGDIVQIKVKNSQDGALSEEVVEFNCKRRLIVRNNTPVKQGSAGEAVLNEACKNPWAFWK